MNEYSRALGTLGSERKALFLTSSKWSSPPVILDPHPSHCKDSRGCLLLESSAMQTCPLTCADLSCKLLLTRPVCILDPLLWLASKSFLNCWWFCDGAGYTSVDLLHFGVIPVLKAEEARVFFEQRGIAVCSVKLGTDSSFKSYCNI